MEREQIYVGEIRTRRSGEPRYAVVHVLSDDGTACISSQISKDHLVGYLEGASAGPWRKVDISNGIPEEYTSALTARKVRELSHRDFQNVLQCGGLGPERERPDLNKGRGSSRLPS